MVAALLVAAAIGLHLVAESLLVLVVVLVGLAMILHAGGSPFGQH